MGWTAYYQILRDQPLSDAEVAALATYIETTNREPWESEWFNLDVTRAARADRVLGQGIQKLPMDMEESDDHQRLCRVLDGLHAIVPGIEIRISDDFDLFGFDDDGVSTEGDRGEAPISIPREDRETFAPPRKLAMTPSGA